MSDDVTHYMQATSRLRRELSEVTTDRNNLLNTVRQIADGEVPGVIFAENDLISAFAQEALDRRNRGKNISFNETKP